MLNPNGESFLTRFRLSVRIQGRGDNASPIDYEWLTPKMDLLNQ
ncbi:hypothetical protein VCHA41O246_70042 [Vibrio chagasii]|nr:hypothetical protein VCHA41O246_70042 [Vibrio chagasii]